MLSPDIQIVCEQLQKCRKSEIGYLSAKWFQICLPCILACFLVKKCGACFYLACIYLLAESPEILSIFREGLQYMNGCCLKLGQFCGLGFFLFKRDSWLSLWQTLLPKSLQRMMGKLSYSHPQVKQSASSCLFCCLSMEWQLALSMFGFAKN